MRIATLLTALLLGTAAHAMPVDATRAEQVARNFWNNQHDKDVPALTSAMHALDTRWDAFYIFTSDEATGFVIVSADDCVQPILGYSFRNPVQRDGFNPELTWWLNGYQQQIDACREIGALPSDAVTADWERWEQGNTDTPAAPKGVAQLLTTQWDQGNPYNLFCPTTNSGIYGRAVTGCVATAMAQVMRYWSHPQRGTGSHTYTPEYYNGSSLFGTQSVDFSSTEYDWDNMPDRLSSTSTTTEKEAVATLMYHCGVAVDMQYGTSQQGGSGAFVQNIPYLSYSQTLNGMVNFFGYSSNATALQRKKYEDQEWLNIVRVELRAHRPVIYSGGDPEGGHCFVCDGFGGLGFFHFNWGWSGVGDGDFTLNNLVPGSGGVGGGNYSFNDDQEIIIGLQPHNENDSLCIIREFPYYQNFETAPTCWSAESNRSYSYGTWQVKDINGVDGNYSASVTAPSYNGSDDHLLSPSICDPGQYKLSWQARSFGQGSNDIYSVNTDTLLLSDTLRSTNWVQRETTFEITEGDTVRLDFHYTFTGGSTGVMVDRITIEKLWDAGIDETPVAHRCRLYPNPTNGTLRIESEAPLLRVELLDINGRSLQRTTTQALELGGLPTGLYLLRVTTASGVETHRVMKR